MESFRNPVDLLCEVGDTGAAASPALVSECAVLFAGRPFDVTAEVRAGFDAWSAGGGGGVPGSVPTAHFSACRWRRIVLHPTAWVELYGGAAAQVRRIFRGSGLLVGGDLLVLRFLGLRFLGLRFLRLRFLGLLFLGHLVLVRIAEVLLLHLVVDHTVVP